MTLHLRAGAASYHAGPSSCACGWLARAATPCSNKSGVAGPAAQRSSKRQSRSNRSSDEERAQAARLRDQHHPRQAGAAADCHEPGEALPKQQPGQQGREDRACVEDDGLRTEGRGQLAHAACSEQAQSEI